MRVLGDFDSSIFRVKVLRVCIPKLKIKITRTLLVCLCDDTAIARVSFVRRMASMPISMAAPTFDSCCSTWCSRAAVLLLICWRRTSNSSFPSCQDSALATSAGFFQGKSVTSRLLSDVLSYCVLQAGNLIVIRLNCYKPELLALLIVSRGIV